MRTDVFNGRLSNDERETILVYDNVNKKWYADTTIPKHLNKFIKMGWTQTSECIGPDGDVIGGGFEAPGRSITIRNSQKKQMSEAQLSNLSDDDDE